MRKINPEKHAAKRRQILEAALLCFAEQGFHKSTTAAICARAGMSPGNVFHYFASKDELIEAIVDEDRQETAARFAQAEAQPQLFSALLHLVDDNLEQFADPLYGRIAMEVLAEAVRNPRVWGRVAAGESEKKAALARMLTLAMTRGQIAPTQAPEQAADWILLLLDGAFGRAISDPGFEAAAYAGRLHEAITRLLRPAPTGFDNNGKDLP